jgi:hypothetical protein
MVDLVEVDTFEFMFIESGCWLKDAEGDIMGLLFDAYIYLINKDKYFSQVSLIFIMIACKFLINLLGNLAQFSIVRVVQVKLYHVVTQFYEFRLDRVFLHNCSPILNLSKEGKLIFNISAKLLESYHVMFRTCICAAEGINLIDNG